MIKKKPVIASNVGGIPEIVKDGETGFLVNKGDSEKITFLINERIEIYSKYKNVFASSIMNMQKFKSVRDGFIEGNLRLKKRFEDIIPEALKLSLLDQAYLDTSISFASWYRLSIFYKFSDQMVIDKFSSETSRLLNLEG